jgi:selenocysteine-specific elongation factor
VYGDLQGEIIRELKEYHHHFPLKEGLSREELRTTLARGEGVDPKIFGMALRDLERNGEVSAEKETIRLAGHRVQLKGEMGDLRGKIEGLYRDGGATPPTVKEVLERFPDRKKEIVNLLQVMTREGDLFRISEDLNFHKDALARLREDYRQFLIREGRATPASFKEITGLTRKFIIPLMEYFDMTKLTVRTGEYRILRKRQDK